MTKFWCDIVTIAVLFRWASGTISVPGTGQSQKAWLSVSSINPARRFVALSNLRELRTRARSSTTVAVRHYAPCFTPACLSVHAYRKCLYMYTLIPVPPVSSSAGSVLMSSVQRRRRFAACPGRPARRRRLFPSVPSAALLKSGNGGGSRAVATRPGNVAPRGG